MTCVARTRTAALLLVLLPTAAVEGALGPRSERYRALQAGLARGWNTWSPYSMLQHVLLPEGLAVTLSVKPTHVSGRYLPEALAHNSRPEKVRPGPRSDDGRYTS